jgi:hypothetical protein
MTRYITLAVIVLSFVHPVCAADKPVFNVDVFCGWDNHYRPMEWTPVEIGITTNLTEPLQSSIIFSAKQDGMNTMNITHDCPITPGVVLNLPLVAKFAFGTDTCTLKVVEESSRSIHFQKNFSLWNAPNRNKLMTILTSSDFLVGLIGSRRFGITKLPENSVSHIADQSGKVFVAPKYPRMAPWDWTGYCSLDVLVLNNPNWDVFNQHQMRALTQWIANGGNLLIVLGTNPFPADSELAKYLPFEPQAGGTQLTIDRGLLSRLAIHTSEPQNAVCTPLRPKADARFCRYWQIQSGECLFATGYAGFGRVGMLAFDPTQMSEQIAGDPSKFWVKLISDVIRCSDDNSTMALLRDDAPLQPSGTCVLTGDGVHPDSKPTGLMLTLEGLEPGNYLIKTWHNRPQLSFSNIDIIVDDTLRNGDVTQSSVTDDAFASEARTSFEVGENRKTAIEFRPRQSSYSQRAVLCGFELSRRSGADAAAMERILAVDFGASDQNVRNGFIGLGSIAKQESRRRTARRIESQRRFNESHGLPDGITVSIETTGDDTLEFTRSTPTPRRQERLSEPHAASPLIRTIAYQTESDAAADEREMNRRRRRGNMFATGYGQAGLNAVMEYLYNIAQMRPLSIWWVILLLTTLALLLGPVDYLVLKRYDRLPLTWLTCAMWIGLFTAGAYYGVQALRGGKMQLRAVSVVDAVDANDAAWSTTYSGLFAPYSADYRLDRLKNNQWWSAISPSSDHMYQRGTSIVGRDIYCKQYDGGNIPSSLPINIWTMQCLLTESSVPGFPFTAELSQSSGRVHLTVTNLSDQPISGGFVLLDVDRMIKFGAVSQHDTGRFDNAVVSDSVLKRWFNHRDRDQLISNISGSFQIEKTFFAQGALRRTTAMQNYLTEGAAVVCARYDEIPLPFGIKDRSYISTHQQIARLVVFPNDNGESTDNISRKVSRK